MLLVLVLLHTLFCCCPSRNYGRLPPLLHVQGLQRI
jgi:hypothetical protein